MFEAGCDIDNVTEFLQQKLKYGVGINKLTIIDPYFFKYSNSKFAISKKILVDTLANFSNLTTLEVVTPATYTVRKKEKLEAEIISVVPNLHSIDIIHIDAFHDRFWISNDEKGFLVGTSINGIGNKHFFIQDDYLSSTDIEVLLNLYRDN